MSAEGYFRAIRAAWKPGQAGGGAGRPALEREVTREARALSIEVLGQLATIMHDKKAQSIARVRAGEIILERAFGKAPQRLVLESDAAGMDNPALAAWLRQQFELLANTIEGEVEGSE